MKICPRCGSEFQDRVERCLDCSVPLLPELEILTLDASPTDVCVESGDAATLRALSVALRARGIPTRLAEESNGLGLGLSLFWGVTIEVRRIHRLYVAAEDAAEARVVAGEILGERDDEPRPVAYGEGRCPACGEPVGEDAAECPRCSLVLDSPPLAQDLAGPEVDALGLPLPSDRRGR